MHETSSLFAFMSACTFVLGACADSSTAANASKADESSGLDAACTPGSAYVDASFPYEPGKDANLPACPMRCGAERRPQTGTSVGVSAADLPSGACTNEPACSAIAEYPCNPCPADGEPLGPRNGYVCSCESGTWKCVMTSQGSDACKQASACTSDAGTDASTDAGSDAGVDASTDASTDAGT